MFLSNETGTGNPIQRVFQYCKECGKPTVYSYLSGMEEQAKLYACNCRYKLPRDFNKIIN